MTQEQFGEMVLQYEKLVYTICYQFTHNHHTAQDLAQDTFYSAFTHIDSCPSGSEKPWLARIATNKAKDFLKSAYNRRIVSSADDTLPQENGALFLTTPQPEDITLEKEAIEKISNNIQTLKEPYLQVSILFFLEEKSVEEISVILKRPPKTIHTQLYRAKQKLQEFLKGESEDGIIQK